MRIVKFAVLCLALFTIAAEAQGPVLHRPPDPTQLARPPIGQRTPPTGQELLNPAEFCTAEGLLIAWSGWEQRLVSDVVYEIARDDLVYVLVRNAGTQGTATYWFEQRGVNMANVVFITDANISTSSMWIRDYGPFCIYEDGVEGIVDFRYGTYSGDENVPLTIANYFGLPYYNSLLLHHGGNHITDGNGMCFGSTNFWQYNPGWPQAAVRQEMVDYLGIDSLIVIDPLAGDFTNHIDMWCKLLSDTLFIVGEYDEPNHGHLNDYEYLNDLAAYLDGLQNLQGRDFAVARMPMNPIEYGGPAGRTNKTYTNSLILNNKVLVPIYNLPLDEVALQIYRDLMPGYEVIGIDSETIIEYAGAIHCMVNTLHAANPLMVLHAPIDSVAVGTAPRIRFSLNPGFADIESSVFYRLTSLPDYTEVSAVFGGGAWIAQLPAMAEDFDYYITATATPGEQVMTALLPENAPQTTFGVTVVDYAGIGSADLLLELPGIAPNPCVGRTEIDFRLAAPAIVKAAIYDVNGARVRTLRPSNHLLAAVRHRLVWNGRDDRNRPLPAGAYWFRLVAGDTERSERIVLLR